ncbi:MAG: tripartite tricarboxylate transporter substrate binding protein [Betaproteobacteria bacterium]|nr:tripartite tricarboxylate transporter substrate binding protein [Betaproteobacteria bacterium]
MNKGIKLTGAVLAGITVIASAHAQQSYPQKPIRVIVPFVPGGATDVLARLTGARFQAAWGQPVVVENRAGAGGNIGTEIVAKAPPDGYALLMNSASATVNVTLYPKLPFDLRRDFAPITTVASAPLLFVVHPSVPVKSMKELIALAKSRKDPIVYGTNGIGTTGHLALELLQQLAGVKFIHVQYKGAGATVVALASGEVSVAAPAVTSARPHVVSGRMRALAVSTERKSSVFPELPTVASLFPGFDIDNWFGYWAPAGTPQAIINQVHAEAVKSLQHQDLKTS